MRRLAGLEIANVTSATANSAVGILIPWLVLDLHGSSTAAGLVVGAGGVATLVAAPFVGALVARFGRRRVSVLSDLLSAASVTLFPIAAASGALTVPVAVVLTVLGAAVDPAGYTARKSMIVGVAEAEGRRLAAVNGWHEAVTALGWVAGPAVGAALIATLGAVPGMWVMAVLFGLAIGSVALMGALPRTAEPGRPGLGVFRSTWSGVRALRADRGLFALALVFVVLAGLYSPLESVVLSRYFKDAGRPEMLGAVLSAISLGVVAGSLAYPRLARVLAPSRMIVVGVLLIGVAIAGMALLPPIVPFLLLGLLLGLAYGPIAPLENQLVQERIPVGLQSQVFGLQLSLFSAATPVGAAVIGLVVDRTGPQQAIAAVAAVFLVMAVVVARSRALRALDPEDGRS